MIYEKEINGVKFTFVCESWGNRNEWGHEVTLYKNCVKIQTYKVRYYNRTWESYQYQSAIKGVIYNAKKALVEALKESFKAARGYKIITKKRAKDFALYLSQNAAYNAYNDLYNVF